MNNFTWESQKKVGDIGEKKVRDLMRARGHEVENLADDPQYWDKDIDMRVSGQTVEVKTDNVMHRTGNLFIEYETLCASGEVHKGWFEITEAQYLFYLDNVNEILHIYDMGELKEYVNQKRRYLEKKCLSFASGKEVWGYLLPYGRITHATINLKEASAWQKLSLAA